MTLDASYTCDACASVVTVSLQVPDGTSLSDVAADLAAYDFEAHVTHDLREHLDGLVAS